MTFALGIIVIIVALVTGGIRYAYLTRKNRNNAGARRSPGKGALRAFGGTLAVGILLSAAFIGWVVYVMEPVA